MERPTCETCPYWQELSNGNGGCHRNAPRPTFTEVDGEVDAFRIWPTVEMDDWCGEHPDFPAYIESMKTQSA